MAKKPAGQPGDIVLSNGTTYNPVTQTSGTTWKQSGPQGGSTTVNPDFDWNAWNKQSDGSTPQDTTPAAPDPYTEYLKAEQARLEALRIKNANAIMSGQMEAFGLGELASQITAWIQEGYEADAIMALVRQTDAYTARFPAMKALQQKGRSISESEYIAYEQTMAQYERMYGLPQGMLSSKDMVTRSLTNELSAAEVQQRATRAAASAYSLPPEFRKTMQDYYGIDSGGLTAYMLDPDVANPLLEKQFVSAQIGMEASMKGLTVDKALSEALYQGGVDRDRASQGFGQVAYTDQFGTGRGEQITQTERIGAVLQGDTKAGTKMERIQKGRTNRFSGGGQYTSEKSGVSGLGSE